MALTLKNPASDLAVALNGQTVGGVALVSGENLFWRQMHPMPMGMVVQLLNTGGPPPEPYLSSTASSMYRSNVQALVFGMPGEDGFTAGEALARGVAGYLHQLIPSGYITILARDGAPVELPLDPDSQRHSWGIALEALYIA